MDVTRMSSDRLLEPWVGSLVTTFEGISSAEDWRMQDCESQIKDEDMAFELSLTYDTICLDSTVDAERFTPTSWPSIIQGLGVTEPCTSDSVCSVASSQGDTVGSPGKRSTLSGFRKKSKVKDPSRFCHICLRRSGSSVSQVVCANFYRDGSCRKVVCRSCIDRYVLDSTTKVLITADWICPHCKDQCPKKAQCKTYERINARRQRGLIKQDVTVQSPKVAQSRALFN